jgi:carbonic anhydrase
VHGWVYGLKDGRARDLGMRASSEAESVEIYREVIQKLRSA